MKIRLKEDPREWRKSVLLTALGLALVSAALRWRAVLPPAVWLGVLGALGLVVLAAFLFPRWFRGYYRWSMRVGVALGYFVARIILFVIFFVLLTPLGFALRLTGKDLLRLKRARSNSYWSEAPESGPLDRLF